VAAALKLMEMLSFFSFFLLQNIFYESLKSNTMRYYITLPEVPVKDGNDYKIIKVNEADEANFLEDYGSKIITSGNSLMEALLNFEQVKNEG
jgi:hypothetical protein